jgi:Flp pilus assembly protein TadD
MRREADALATALRAALAAHGVGDCAAACAHLDAAARVAPEHPDLLHLRGLVALSDGHPAAGRDWLLRAVRAAPRTALYWNNLGVAQRQCGALDDAVRAHRRAISLDPAYASAHNNLGAVLASLGSFREAANSFVTARRLGARDLDTRDNAATALARAGDPAAVLAIVAEAQSAGDKTPRLAIAEALAELARGARAQACAILEAATDHWPADSELWHNFGYVLEKSDRLLASRQALRRALRLAPDSTATRRSLGLVLLSLRAYGAGWPLLQPASAVPLLRLPRDLAGRRIRIRQDQGVGDDLFFLRFAPRLRWRGARLSLDVDPRLLGMLRRSGLEDPVDAPEHGEVIVMPSGALPCALAHGIDSGFPSSLRLRPDPERLARRRGWLDAIGPRPWIAVAWRAGIAANPKHVPPEALGSALRGAPGTIIVVQRAPDPAEAAAFGVGLERRPIDACDANEDLEEMLAVMALVDRHVAVSSTNTHLRAACGRSSDVLVPSPAEWRWRPDEAGFVPWFPDHRVYREDSRGGWSAALGRLAKTAAGWGRDLPSM